MFKARLNVSISTKLGTERVLVQCNLELPFPPFVGLYIVSRDDSGCLEFCAKEVTWCEDKNFFELFDETIRVEDTSPLEYAKEHYLQSSSRWRVE